MFHTERSFNWHRHAWQTGFMRPQAKLCCQLIRQIIRLDCWRTSLRQWEPDMAKQQSKKCSKNLGDAEIKKIVEILDGWPDKLTWDLLVNAIELCVQSPHSPSTVQT
ncbi:MAG TPA: hypothetical protein PKA47_18400 [Accumulibacter sp.]|uniref:hypothetical protein n=1 Tax=Pseudomonadota TaxID=1224 RepID=UPI002C9944B1|nr:hypothetical protein [Accumulibacter sp.]HMW57560.1 hypothetical protein [Accumulibacter sp.]